MQINCIIVEDEPLAQERTKGYVGKLPFLNLLCVFDNAVEALLFLRSTRVDLIFLDINMGEFSGIQLLESLPVTSQVIIITAYHEYALKGFELNVTDYLLKPYTFERFLQAVDRAQNNLVRSEALVRAEAMVKPEAPVKAGASLADKRFIFIKTEYRLEKVFLSEILFIEGMRDYRRVHTVHKPIMTLQLFGEFEEEIPPAIICRVHKSYMVSIDKIDSIERNTIRIGERMIPISDTYRRRFFELIHHSE
jgi:two-component system LytT family response regulator